MYSQRHLTQFLCIILFCTVSCKRKLRMKVQSCRDGKKNQSENSISIQSKQTNSPGELGTKRIGSQSCFLLIEWGFHSYIDLKDVEELSPMLIKHFMLLRRKGECKVCRIFVQLELRILVPEPSGGEKTLFMCSDLALSLMGRQGRQKCRLVSRLRPPDWPCVRLCMPAGICTQQYVPPKARQATMHCCF